MKRKLQLLVGLLISGGFLWYSFSKANLPRLWTTLQTINAWYMLPFVAVTMFTMWIRAVRWRMLLAPTVAVTSAQTWRPLMIGFAFNGIFPARAGEFVRAWLVAKRHGGAFTGAFATVIVERLYDSLLLVLVVLFIFTAYDFTILEGRTWDSRWTLEAGTLRTLLAGAILGLLLLGALSAWAARRRRVEGAARGGGAAVAGLVLIAVSVLACGVALAAIASREEPFAGGRVVTIDGPMLQTLGQRLVVLLLVLLAGSLLLLLPMFRRLGERILGALPLPAALAEKLLHMFRAVTQGFDSLKSPATVVGVMGLSIALWLVVGFTLQVMWWGFPAAAASPMSVIDGLCVTMLISLAIMIPAAPGYWGLYEIGCVLALQLLGITDDYELALGYSLVIHALQMIPIIGLGLWYAARDNIRPADLIDEAEARAGDDPPATPAA